MDERSERISKRFELPMLIGALLVIPVIVIEQSAWGDAWKTVASILNWVIWLAFATELVVMLTVVPNRRWWLLHHPLEVLIVLLTPPFLPAALQAARVLRLLRLLRLIRVVVVARRLFSLEGVRWMTLLAVMTALVGGAAFASVEGISTWDGVWWAVATMTTVGYGDIYPDTDTGRVIAMGVMVVGIGFLSILIGAVAQRFVESEVREDVEEAQEVVVAEVDAAEAEVLGELRSITARLQQLEARLEQRPSG